MPYLLSRGNIDANAWNEISAVLTKNVFLFGFNNKIVVFLKHSVFAFQQAEQQMANAVKQSMGLVDFKVT